MSKFPAVELDTLFKDLAQLERHGTHYGLGAKAPSLSAEPNAIGAIDCSGYVRWAIFRATDGQLKIPDGSQNQRAFFEQAAKDPTSGVKKVAYRDAAAYITKKRLFIAFIKPFEHGCGPVGHVWLVAEHDDGNNGTKAGTLESHGGHGPNSRPWNYPVLLREQYECFEIPCV